MGYRFAVMSGIFLLLFSSGCATTRSESAPAVVKRTQMQMGTLVTITSVASDRRRAQDAASAGFQEIHRLEELLSTWIATSELSQVNAAAGRDAVMLSRDTMKVLEASLEMARLTEGGFNILVGPAVEAWSVLDRQHIPSDAVLQAVRPLTDLRSLQLNVAERTVYWAKPGMRVDVGGIGKGFAADMAVAAMQAATSIMRAQQIVVARVDGALEPWSLTFARYEVLEMPDDTARLNALKTGQIDAGHYVSQDGGPRIMRSVIYLRNCHGRADATRAPGDQGDLVLNVHRPFPIKTGQPDKPGCPAKMYDISS